MKFKKLQVIFCSVMINILLVVSANAETENECFETVSRGIFKFNQGFDNIILEPVAKAYNKLPEPGSSMGDGGNLHPCSHSPSKPKALSSGSLGGNALPEDQRRSEPAPDEA